MRSLLAPLLLLALLLPLSSPRAQVVSTANGRVEGTPVSDGVHAFKGIPYAKPPIGERRWRPPQPVESWSGVRSATRFGPRCMQTRPYGDMIFRSAGMSEDCLYLNVWTPADAPTGSLPVLVYFYGGGFIAGDGSEPRYDGASMAREDIVVVTLNYRLGVFGFMAHPALTAESPEQASGNYGLLDQAQALRWVQNNIAAFGGDPDRVTIGGESAGSMSVSGHLASPLSTGRFARAIGESGALLGALSPSSLADAEEKGSRFADQVGADSLAELRALSSSRLLEHAAKPTAPRFGVTVDGHFLSMPPSEVYAEKEQARVPLLVGWNSKESDYRAIIGNDPPTPTVYKSAVRDLYGDRADRALELYAANTWTEVLQAGTDLASDRFMGYPTWKWSDRHRRTGPPVYRYFYTHPRPPMKPGKGNNVPGLAGTNENAGRITPPRGAVHAAEIEYALGTLDTNDIYAWTPTDRTVSRYMKSYFANFIKTGDPNGEALPAWPMAGSDEQAMVMRLNATPEAVPARHPDRYQFLDAVASE
ncbi:carboxylesterase [Salinibacter sp. 10B]|uniref:carboxylesterase/lipase family protein n=1 Tax=Salinibacter sp. 10B TaxID=1923971 RepID=UPI000CF44061|nr:carboxylesterase/lipase family protein [Salinibacter sp. 10B]PQJ34357.1 carboxylesterase [Salinibacter sp. 10B]